MTSLGGECSYGLCVIDERFIDFDVNPHRHPTGIPELVTREYRGAVGRSIVVRPSSWGPDLSTQDGGGPGSSPSRDEDVPPVDKGGAGH